MLTRHLGRSKALAGGPRVHGREEKLDLVLKKRMGLQRAGQLVLHRDGKVAIAFLHGLHRGSGILQPHHHGNLRIGFTELPQDRREEHLGHRRAEDDGQLSPRIGEARGDRVHSPVDMIEDAHDLAVKHAPLGREMHRFALFGEKRAAQLDLQTLHSVADRGLSDAQSRGGASMAARLGDHREHPQQSQIQVLRHA